MASVDSAGAPVAGEKGSECKRRQTDGTGEVGMVKKSVGKIRRKPFKDVTVYL